MQEIIIVTHKKLIVAIPVLDLVKLQEGDSVAGVVVIDKAEQKPEEVK